MKSKPLTHRDYLEWYKEHPLKFIKPFKKKPKWMDEVWVSFTKGDACKGWVLSLTGGDFSTSMKRNMYGDRIEIFFPPTRGEKFYKGTKTFQLMDIGIGKTLEECHESYCKHDWFRRPKAEIQHDRFFAYHENKKTEQ